MERRSCLSYEDLHYGPEGGEDAQRLTEADLDALVTLGQMLTSRQDPVSHEVSMGGRARAREYMKGLHSAAHMRASALRLMWWQAAAVLLGAGGCTWPLIPQQVPATGPMGWTPLFPMCGGTSPPLVLGEIHGSPGPR